MNIALFGGTFDPIHTGHLRAARTAVRKLRLGRVLFVPTGNPPHKNRRGMTPFVDRFAMVSLACGGEPRFVPSLLEAPRPDGRPQFSIATVRAVKRSLRPRDKLYFLIGVDAFHELHLWKDYKQLLDLVNFIVVSRPGFDSSETRKVLPGSHLRPGRRVKGDRIQLRNSTLYILRGVNETASSHEIRVLIRAGKSVTGLVPPPVEEYIVKEGLYRSGRSGRKS